MDNYKDIVISSRIRLARNFSDVVFPNKIKTKLEADSVICRVFELLDNFENYKVTDLDKNILNSLQEKHLISEELVDNEQFGALSLSYDETISIMINEEEHLREQCILKGFNLDEALEKLNAVDDLLLEHLPIAYSSKYGFLTTCPSNLGTGMRASVMLFLPALTLTKNLEPIMNTLHKVGLTVRGRYGENSGYDGFMFQISNSQTLGVSEQQIISNVTTAILKICEKECDAREKLLSDNFTELKDTIFKAYGTLKYAYKLSLGEAIKLLSQVKFGLSLDLFNFEIPCIDELFDDIQPYSLKTIKGEDLSNEEIDIFRAEYISSKI